MNVSFGQQPQYEVHRRKSTGEEVLTISQFPGGVFEWHPVGKTLPGQPPFRMVSKAKAEALARSLKGFVVEASGRQGHSHEDARLSRRGSPCTPSWGAMDKIASPQELQAELEAIRAFVHHSEKPDRQVVASKLRALADRVADPVFSKTATGAADFSRMVSAFMLNPKSNDLHKSVKAWLKAHLKREGVALPEGRLEAQAHDLIYSFDGKTAKAATDAYNSMMKFLKAEYPAKK